LIQRTHISFLRRSYTPPERRIKQLFGLESARLREFTVLPPTCTLIDGAPGIAYALLRASELVQDAELLRAAQSWIEKAEQHSEKRGAYSRVRVVATRRIIDDGSLSFGRPGLFFTKSLVCAATGDVEGTRKAVEKFLSAARSWHFEPYDLFLGGVGLAVGSDRLAGLQFAKGYRQELRAMRNKLIARAWQHIGNAFENGRWLGFAHGVAGVVFGSLVSDNSSKALNAADRLRRMSVKTRKGIRWPVTVGSNEFASGWCHGIAGHLLMWTRVWQCSRLPEDREMMERCAWGVLELPTSLGKVCCGAAGQAVALAEFALATDEPSWQRRARQLLANLRPRWRKNSRPQGLFHGQLGLALARLECEACSPRFPVWGMSLGVEDDQRPLIRQS
jgi:serine/threonine-protein kinase